MFVLFLSARPCFQPPGHFNRAWNSVLLFILSFPPCSVYFLLDPSKTYWQLNNTSASCPWYSCTKALQIRAKSFCSVQCFLLDWTGLILSFRSPWACPFLLVRRWISKVTVKRGFFLWPLVYADIYPACSSQLCSLHKEAKLMQLLRRLFSTLTELAPEPRLGEWCNLSPPSSTWKIAFRAIALASFMCLKFQNDENKEKK